MDDKLPGVRSSHYIPDSFQWMVVASPAAEFMARNR